MRFLAFVGLLAIAVAIAGGIYFFGGFFDVAASNGGNAVVEWAVENVREASLNRHATAPPVPAWFNDPQTVRAGAHEFTTAGCVRCHGAPGVKRDTFAQGMDPKPPDLAKANADDPPGYVFWIVKHGIRMTAMPAFGGLASDQAIWRAVSFVKHLKSITPAQYKAWRGGEAPMAAGSQAPKAASGQAHDGAATPPASAPAH